MAEYCWQGPDFLSAGRIPHFRDITYLPSGHGYPVQSPREQLAMNLLFGSGNPPPPQNFTDYDDFQHWSGTKEFRAALNIRNVRLHCSDDFDQAYPVEQNIEMFKNFVLLQARELQSPPIVLDTLLRDVVSKKLRAVMRDINAKDYHHVGKTLSETLIDAEHSQHLEEIIALLPVVALLAVRTNDALWALVLISACEVKRRYVSNQQIREIIDSVKELAHEKVDDRTFDSRLEEGYGYDLRSAAALALNIADRAATS